MMRDQINKLAFRRRRLLDERAQAAAALGRVNSELEAVDAQLQALKKADMEMRVNLTHARAT